MTHDDLAAAQREAGRKHVIVYPVDDPAPGGLPRTSGKDER